MIKTKLYNEDNNGNDVYGVTTFQPSVGASGVINFEKAVDDLTKNLFPVEFTRLRVRVEGTTADGRLYSLVDTVKVFDDGNVNDEFTPEQVEKLLEVVWREGDEE